MLKLLSWTAAAAVFLTAAAVTSPAPAQSSVYFIGNSVTDTINYDRFSALLAEGGKTADVGRHTIPGAPLSWIWEHPDGGAWMEQHGPFLQALTSRAWNVLSLEPFDRQLDGGPDSDAEMGAAFIREALKATPPAPLRVLVYSRWPRRDSETALTFYGRSYTDQWDREYTNPSWDGGNETRDYFEKVLANWRGQFPGLRIDLVPVGDVLDRLSRQIEAGAAPGLSDITDLYADAIHFHTDRPEGDIGSCLVAMTFYSVIFGEPPPSSAPRLWEINDSGLARLLRDIVWETVSTNPLTGVKPAPLSSSP